MEDDTLEKPFSVAASVIEDPDQGLSDEERAAIVRSLLIWRFLASLIE